MMTLWYSMFHDLSFSLFCLLFWSLVAVPVLSVKRISSLISYFRIVNSSNGLTYTECPFLSIFSPWIDVLLVIAIPFLSCLLSFRSILLLRNQAFYVSCFFVFSSRALFSLFFCLNLSLFPYLPTQNFWKAYLRLVYCLLSDSGRSCVFVSNG